ncbi:hypothetical protein [Bradyrhizobium ottawaense]
MTGKKNEADDERSRNKAPADKSEQQQPKAEDLPQGVPPYKD